MVIIFGSVNLDLFYRVPHVPQGGETLLIPAHVNSPGGKGANQAVAVAKMGSPALFVCAVGKDGFANYLLDYLQSQGVDTKLAQTVDTPTGTAIIILESNGENRILVSSGANYETKSASVPDAALVPENILLIQMETKVDEICALIDRASAKKMRIVLNMAPAIFPGEDALKKIDILIVNEVELSQIYSELGRGERTDSILERASFVSETYGIDCVVTLGAEGVLCRTKDGEILKSAALPLDEVVDTTGAGDALCGAFTAALEQGMSLQEALDIGCIAGSLACLKLGASESYADREQILSLMDAAHTPIAVKN